MSKAGRGVLVVVFALTCFGLVMTYSASAVFSDQKLGHSGYYFWRQLAYALLGFGALLGASHVNPFWIRRRSRLFLLAAFFLLLLVFLPGIGQPAGGAHRWIGFSGFRFQPSEYVKLALLVWLSDYLMRKQGPLHLGRRGVFLGPAFVMGLLGVAIMAQPDLGTVVMLAMLTVSLFFLAGVRMRFLVGAALMLVPGIAFLIISAPYRLRRILAFLNPWADARGSGFQIIQSFLAFGLGGLKGVGLGASTQKLFYLPQSHTDFIFSIVGEELGLAGTFFVVLLFGLFFYFGLQIAKRSYHPYLKLLSFALIFLIMFQAVVNMFVTTGMIPTKGLPLPFMSYGGSALLFNMMAVGLLVGIDRFLEAKCDLY